ncbi:hypothetical protein ACJ6WF_30770 [Streptomyces sp. MMS24-I2-30]|uniref:hypothetical protein n=1 Tax=Streptomyces sp. MMS24-I2-30 TaxID=3351564 RepID=UPI003896DFED
MAATVAALGSWALWPVYQPCVTFTGAYIPLGAPKAEADAIERRAYERALADGACGPKRARFHNWIG